MKEMKKKNDNLKKKRIKGKNFEKNEKNDRLDAL